MVQQIKVGVQITRFFLEYYFVYTDTTLTSQSSTRANKSINENVSYDLRMTYQEYSKPQLDEISSNAV